MRVVFYSVFLTLWLVCSSGVQAAYWSDVARQLDIFKGQRIAALASAANRLYVSTGRNVFIVNVDNYSIVEATKHIKKQPKDEVTEILVDAARKELWIALNQNTRLAACYDYDLDARQCSRSFLDERMEIYGRLQKAGIQSSIATLAFDAHEAIVGVFKGGIYMYSMKDWKPRLIYKPSSPYHWPVAATLSEGTAFVATRGDGLIIINRKTGAAARFPEERRDRIRALAVHRSDLYLGAIGLYKAKIDDFLAAAP